MFKRINVGIYFRLKIKILFISICLIPKFITFIIFPYIDLHKPQ